MELVVKDNKKYEGVRGGNYVWDIENAKWIETNLNWWKNTKTITDMEVVSNTIIKDTYDKIQALLTEQLQTPDPMTYKEFYKELMKLRKELRKNHE